MVGSFHGAPVLEVPGTGLVEVGFELLVETRADPVSSGPGGVGEEDAGPPVAVTVPRVGIVLEAVAPAQREEGVQGEEEGGGDEEQSLPSLPPHVAAAAVAPVAVGAQQQPRALRRRLEGEELLRALGCVLPRLMWH